MSLQLTAGVVPEMVLFQFAYHYLSNSGDYDDVGDILVLDAPGPFDRCRHGHPPLWRFVADAAIAALLSVSHLEVCLHCHNIVRAESTLRPGEFSDHLHSVVSETHWREGIPCGISCEVWGAPKRTRG